MKVLALLIIVFLTIRCSQKKSSVDTQHLEYAFLNKDSLVNPNIQGIWKSIGSGYLLEARHDSLLLYSYTKNFCYKEKNNYLEGLLNSESQFRRHGDTISLFLTDYDSKTESLQASRNYILIDTLPASCMTFTEMQQMGAEKQLALYLETMEENYAFTQERQVDWDSIRTHYSNQVSSTTTNEELFQLLGEIATLTEDHHTKVIAQDGRALQFQTVPTAQIVIDSFNNQSRITDLNDFFTSFFAKNYQHISDTLLAGNSHKVLNDKIEWGTLNSTIGYIHIHSFTGFGQGVPRKQQIDSVNFHMEKAIRTLQEKKAIIVDVSFNFGGYDASALTVASFFTDEPIHAFTSQVYQDGKFYNESEIYVQPAKNIAFTKPVYLVTTDISRSAAEGFAMMMDALPNVTLVGTNTLGILSGMLGKSISTFYTTSSNQRLLDPNGKFYEAIGVKPDLPINVFNRPDVFEAHMQTIREVMNIIEQDIKTQP
ncbi:MAG: S41 family peptidase [Bacteroidota bacterium]